MERNYYDEFWKNDPEAVEVGKRLGITNEETRKAWFDKKIREHAQIMKNGGLSRVIERRNEQAQEKIPHKE